MRHRALCPPPAPSPRDDHQPVATAVLHCVSCDPPHPRRYPIAAPPALPQVDTSDTRELNAPSSPVSSAGAPSGSVGGEPFVYRWNGSGSGTPRDGSSPNESPAQTWRGGAPNPPAMAPLPPMANGQGGSYNFFNPQTDLGGMDANMLGMGMGGGMGGMGGVSQPPLSTGASPMRGTVFQPMGGGGGPSAQMIF